VLLSALSLRTGVAAQQSTTVQQTNTASAANSGPGSQSISQRQHNSATITNTGGSSTVTVTQTNTAQGASQTQSASQTSVSQAITSTAASAPAVARATEAVAVAAGCSNVVLSWPTGTALAEVAMAMTPATALTAIFKLDAAEGRYRGYTPTAPAFANDYTAVEAALEAVFVCVNQGASLARPTS
jgi:hypothetical protein